MGYLTALAMGVNDILGLTARRKNLGSWISGAILMIDSFIGITSLQSIHVADVHLQQCNWALAGGYGMQADWDACDPSLGTRYRSSTILIY
jgi:hypothetical protein